MMWREMVELIGAQLNELGYDPPSDAPTDAESALAILSAKAGRIDEICERWCLTRRWPLMLPLEGWLLTLRLIHAQKLAYRLSIPTATGETVRAPDDEAAALRWLLVDSWLPDDPDLIRGIAGAAIRLQQRSKPQEGGDQGSVSA